MSRTIGLSLGFLVTTLLGAGCVPIPVALPEEKPFREASGEWLTTGESTADDIKARLGDPTLDGPDWWLYRQTRDGWGWAYCAGGGYSAGCGTLPRSSTGHFFLVEFDSERVVTGTELFTEKGLCEDRQVCYVDEFLMRADAQSSDDEAQRFAVPSTGCSVYTYSETNSDLAAGELVINGNNAGGLVGTSAYYRHSIAPGSYEWMIATSPDRTLPLPAAIYVLECNEPAVLFLRYRYGLNSFWFNKIEPVDPKRGKQAVARRWLAISPQD